MTNKEQNIKKALNALVALMVLIIGLLLIPWVFNRYLAIHYLLDDEINSLKWVSGIVIGCGMVLFLLRKYVSTKFSMILFGLSILVYMELGFRLYAHYTYTPNEKWQLEILGLQTYPEYTSFAGHPFLHFIQRPWEKNIENKVKNIYTFNSMGFSEDETPFEKPDSVYRIACLGASTTQRGYPRHLERILIENWPHPETEPDVLNFGIGSWTSAHSMVNFLMNVVEYDPDMIVIHHGWNDSEVRNTPPGLFRADYSHAFKYWHEPKIRDKLITRVSLVYRTIKQKMGKKEAWMYLDRNTMKRDRPRANPAHTDYADLNELKPYKRNIKTIIDHALLRNTDVVLLTMPQTTDPNAENSYQGVHIDQCNDIGRELAAEYGSEITFVDLDSIMTGNSNHLFIDLAHVTDEGMTVKSQHIADEILAKIQSSETMTE